MSPEKIIKEDYKTQKLSFEYVLPDYEPTVRRVMLADARLLPNERIVLSDTVTLSGVVEYRMVYQSVDDELSCLSFTVPYECTLSAGDGAVRLFDSVTLSSFSCMPSGPRRVLAKGEVMASLQSVAHAELPSLEEGADVLTLSASFPYTSYVYSPDEQREYAETVAELSDPDTSVLYSDGVLRIDEVRPMKDGAFVGGRCLISAFVCENGKPRQLALEIPFEEFLPMGTMLEEDAHLRCEGSIRSLSLAVQTQEGVSTLVANALVSFMASAAEENEVRLPLDAYSTSCELSTEMGEQTLSCERYSTLCRQTLTMKLSPEGADPAPMAQLLYAVPAVKILECTAKKDAIELSVSLSLSLVGTDKSEESMTPTAENENERESSMASAGFVRQRGTESFCLSIPMKGARAGMKCKTSSPCVFGVNAFVEDGAFNISAELSLFVSLCDEIRVPVCVGIRRGEEHIEREEDAVSIVFPHAGDTLWSLAKHNHARIDDILRENPEIQCGSDLWNRTDSLVGIKHVFIP